MNCTDLYFLEMCDRGRTNSRFDFERGRLKTFLDEGLIEYEKVTATHFKISLTEKGKEALAR